MRLLLPQIQTHSSQRPTLVFCASRRACVLSAGTILSKAKERHHSQLGPFVQNARHAQDLRALSDRISQPQLKDLVRHGVAFHHAAMEAPDRHAVQNSFLKGHLRVLVATSGLSLGVNLPAHLVVIKGTRQWKGAGQG